MNKQDLALDILQEECAELIVAISKCKRFGMYASHEDILNKDILVQEMSDVIKMMEITCRIHCVLNDQLEKGKELKEKKLKMYAPDLFENDHLNAEIWWTELSTIDKEIIKRNLLNNSSDKPTRDQIYGMWNTFNA